MNCSDGKEKIKNNSEGIVIRTGKFRISNGRFVSALIGKFGGKWIVIMSVLFLSGAIIAGIFSDLRWIAVAAMLLFVIFPMIIGFLYFDYGLRKECYCNALPHSLEISSIGIIVKVDVTIPSGDDENESESEPEQRIYEVFFPKNEIEGYTIINNGIRVNVRSEKRGFIIVPYDIFDSQDDFRAVINFLIS